MWQNWSFFKSVVKLNQLTLNIPSRTRDKILPCKKPPYRVNTVAPEAQAPPDNAVPDDDDYYAFTTADNLISHEVFQSPFGGGGG